MMLRKLRKEKTLEEMKVDELKAYAAEKNIDLGDAAKKNEIIEKIRTVKETV